MSAFVPCFEPLATLVTQPGDTPEALAQIEQRGGPGADAVVVLPTPSIRDRFWVYRDLLRALGSDPDVHGAPRSAGKLFDQAVGRLMASSAHHLVVARAHMVPSGLLLDWAEAAAICGKRVWLVAQVELLRRSLSDMVNHHGLQVIPFEEFLEAVPEAPTPDASPDQVRFPVVPRTEFPLFLATCQTTLGADEFTRVEEVFAGTHADAAALIDDGGRDEAAIAPFLREQVRRSSCTDEVIVRVRAAQVAAFTRGLHVQVRIEAVVASSEWAPPPGLGSLEVRDLSSLGRTHDAAAAVLALASGASGERLSRLDVADVARDGATVRVGGAVVVIPPMGRELVAAQRATRLLQGGGPGAPLFTKSGPSTSDQYERASSKGVQRFLLRAAEGTGIPLAGAWTAHVNSGATNWANRTGVSVQQIQEAAA